MKYASTLICTPLLALSLLTLSSGCDSADKPAAEDKPAQDAKGAAAEAKSDSKGEAASDAGTVDAAEAVAAAVNPNPAPKPQAKAKVNLNTASKEDFLALPGIGKRMAHEFDEYRPYVSIKQFRKEMAKYVDAERIAEFEMMVFVPVAMNDCDSETLQQLPGVSAELATELIAGRPYADDAAFAEALKAKLGPEELATAQSMLKKG